MKNPNGYGSVIYLGKGRRKPYAVRITDGFRKNKKGVYVQKFKYLEYFEKSKDAYVYLAEYNAGVKVKEHISLTNQPTFSEVYELWLDYKQHLKKAPGASTVRNYGIAYKHMAELHNRKFVSLRLQDLQTCVNKYSDKSESTLSMIRCVLFGMYEYGLKYEIVEKDYSKLVDYQYTDNSETLHIPFTDAEIKQLWENKDKQYIDIVLMLIYTGMRASELCGILTENIHLDEHYIIGGIKTEAGKNRVIPIHDGILPFIEKHYSPDNKYLLLNTVGNRYQYAALNAKPWKTAMISMGMEHTLHDTRHTCATLMKEYGIDDYYRKLILGHSIQDLTDRVYTKTTIKRLVTEINKIPVPQVSK